MYNVGMINYEQKYNTLYSVYRNEVITGKETEDRLMGQLRHQMIATAQVHKELDEARELIDNLLHGDKTDDKEPYLV
jgi:hypothetical protein